ncbi:MAG: DUF2339 domain-containing protein [Deltaproteobacteria bacterium]|nr:DUF2339 domain-containing protein [Deltaproteobacteria bacterium]
MSALEKMVGGGFVSGADVHKEERVKKEDVSYEVVETMGSEIKQDADILDVKDEVLSQPLEPLSDGVSMQDYGEALPRYDGTVLEEQVSQEKGGQSGTGGVIASKVIEYIKNFFTTGNVVVKVGIVILFFGVTFLVKYAADQGYFPVELRMIGVALLGMILTAVGWRLRLKRAGYALVLQGGGIALFYLCVFASFRLFQLIPSSMAIILLLLTVVCSVVLAVGQDARTLAVIGLSGGFMAPVLTSTGSNNYIALFVFYAVLNAGICAIAWFKSWRFLNVLGFFFTFGIGSIWGLKYYEPEFFITTEPFLCLFFLFYVFNTVLFAIRQKPELKGFVDGSLVFGTPLVVLSLQYGLVKDMEYGLAISALVLGFFYLLLAAVILKKVGIQFFKDLIESYLAVGVGFATLTIPLAFNAQYTSAFWALEGAGLVWVGVRQHRILARCFGSLLILTAGFELYNINIAGNHGIGLPVFNGLFLGCLVKSAAAVFAAYYFNKFKDRLKGFECYNEMILVLFGLFWWYFGGTTELRGQVGILYKNIVGATYLVFSLGLMEIIARRLEWKILKHTSFVFAVCCAPFCLDHYWTSIFWSLIGVWKVYDSLKEENKLLTVFAVVLLVISGFIYPEYFGSYDRYRIPSGLLPLFNFYFVSGILRSLSVFVAAYFLCKKYWDSLKPALTVFFFWGLFQWLCTGIWELQVHGPYHGFYYLSLTFTVLSLAVLESLRRRLNWPLLQLPNLLFLPAIVIPTAYTLTNGTGNHPLQEVGYLAWPIVFAHLYRFFKRSDDDGHGSPRVDQWFNFLHVGTLWLLVILTAWELWWQIDRWVPETITWAKTALCLIPASFILLITTQYKRVLWPLLKHAKNYLLTGLIPIILFCLGATLVTSFTSAGDAAPLPYLPLMNPVDLVMAYIFMVFIMWFVVVQRDGLLKISEENVKVIVFATAVLVFIWINAGLIRTIHQWAGVPFTTDGLYNSLLVQMSVSIYWCLIGMLVMIVATQKKWRGTWISGACILGVVVLKLIFIDYFNRGTLEQTLSTIVVGVLFVITGYFSPIPPARKAGLES